MELYTKIVNENEFLFTKIASNANISPKLVSWEQDNEKYIIQIKKYPSTLWDITDRSIYENKIIQLVKKLQSLGIFHNDIHAENIVLDQKSGEVRLIDFGISCWIEDISDILLEKAYREPASSIDHLLELEIIEVSWICTPLEILSQQLKQSCNHAMMKHPTRSILYCKYCCYVHKLCI